MFKIIIILILSLLPLHLISNQCIKMSNLNLLTLDKLLMFNNNINRSLNTLTNNIMHSLSNNSKFNINNFNKMSMISLKLINNLFPNNKIFKQFNHKIKLLTDKVFFLKQINYYSQF